MKCLCCGKEILEKASLQEQETQWHSSCVRKFFGTASLPELDISEDTLTRIATESTNKGFTVPGVQKKMSLHLTADGGKPRLTLVNYPTGYILKPQTEQFVALPEAEYLVMQMAQKTGIATVPFALIRTAGANATMAYITKRIDRFLECVPDDWGEGYDNVVVGCTVENQEMADYRLPIFLSLPIKHKSIIASPLLTAMNLMPYLDETIEEVSVGGESGVEARPCDYDWVLALREQCIAKDVPFRFHQTGARFIKDGRMYRVRRCHQLSQAHKANIDYKIGKYLVPETVRFEWKESDYHNKYNQEAKKT